MKKKESMNDSPSNLKYVYLMRTGDKHYKIGVASNVFNRLKALQTSSSTPIEVITAKRMENAFEVEKSIHHKFSHVKVGGGKEWFKLTDEEVINVAVEINKQSSVDPTELESLKSEIIHESEALHTLAEDHIKQLEGAIDKHTITHTRILKKLESMTAEYNQVGIEKSAKSNNPKHEDVEEIKPIKPVMLYDPLLQRAIEITMTEGKASTSLLQRKLSIGYGRAARIIEKLQDHGVISELDGIKPRTVNLDDAQKLLSEIVSQ